MKKISVESRDRMIEALVFANTLVRRGEYNGLCAGIADAHWMLGFGEVDYLKLWIRQMLNGEDYSYLENLQGYSAYKFTPEERYQHRKPWVEWMIQHLKETT